MSKGYHARAKEGQHRDAQFFISHESRIFLRSPCQTPRFLKKKAAYVHRLFLRVFVGSDVVGTLCFSGVPMVFYHHDVPPSPSNSHPVSDNIALISRLSSVLFRSKHQCFFTLTSRFFNFYKYLLVLEWPSFAVRTSSFH